MEILINEDLKKDFLRIKQIIDSIEINFYKYNKQLGRFEINLDNNDAKLKLYSPFLTDVEISNVIKYKNIDDIISYLLSEIKHKYLTDDNTLKISNINQKIINGLNCKSDDPLIGIMEKIKRQNFDNYYNMLDKTIDNQMRTFKINIDNLILAYEQDRKDNIKLVSKDISKSHLATKIRKTILQALKNIELSKQYNEETFNEYQTIVNNISNKLYELLYTDPFEQDNRVKLAFNNILHSDTITIQNDILENLSSSIFMNYYFYNMYKSKYKTVILIFISFLDIYNLEEDIHKNTLKKLSLSFMELSTFKKHFNEIKNLNKS